jgi:hypothetical protein
MSAYVDRLLQRFAPNDERPVVDAGAAMNPFVRSRSPIAAMDQRLGLDEHLGHGLVEPRLGVGEHELGVSEHELGVRPRIQRKFDHSTPAPTISAPAPSKPSPEAPPGPSSEAPPKPSPARTPASPGPADSSPPSARKQPLDPISLFDPAPRYFDELPTTLAEPEADATLAGAEAEAAEALSPAEPPLAPSTTPSTSPTRISMVEQVITLRPMMPPVSEHEPSRAESGAPSPTPWLQLDLDATSAAPSLPGSRIEPSPRHVSSEPAAKPAPLLYIVPRPAEPEPFVPEPAPPVPEPASSRPERRAAQAEAQAPTTTPTPDPRTNTAPGAGQTLTIDSISQIGPLDRHFPNRRGFRLRYR